MGVPGLSNRDVGALGGLSGIKGSVGEICKIRLGRKTVSGVLWRLMRLGMSLLKIPVPILSVCGI